MHEWMQNIMNKIYKWIENAMQMNKMYKGMQDIMQINRIYKWMQNAELNIHICYSFVSQQG